MILSEEEMDEMQAPLLVRKCCLCGAVFIEDGGCGCGFDSRKLNRPGRKILFVMQRMSKDRPMSSKEIADLCGLPRLSVDMTLKYHARRPSVVWAGGKIAIMAKRGKYWLSRDLSEEERRHRSTVADMMSLVMSKRPKPKGQPVP